MGRDAGEETREIERGREELGVTWANVDTGGLWASKLVLACGVCSTVTQPVSGGDGGGGIYADAP